MADRKSGLRHVAYAGITENTEEKTDYGRQDTSMKTEEEVAEGGDKKGETKTHECEEGSVDNPECNANRVVYRVIIAYSAEGISLH